MCKGESEITKSIKLIKYLIAHFQTNFNFTTLPKLFQDIHVIMLLKIRIKSKKIMSNSIDK